ncbi:hypothetical protein LX32DRAFT_403158 [Colletotrichum zoysiae]|uniref:Uncharacterized protein n=1 Tax=Colletotrichum zoysiae TaxID=1216348 RepID=A0AAD9HHV2_9PEZI|nr:hypothetical protein LX32DRAFT_403158 [Colletotrichum zoysiae]
MQHSACRTSRDRAINLSPPWPFLPRYLQRPLFFLFVFLPLPLVCQRTQRSTARLWGGGKNSVRKVLGRARRCQLAQRGEGEGIREWPPSMLRHVRRVHHLLRRYHLSCPHARAGGHEC